MGDTPYVIDENNQDNHPLMNPSEITELPEFLSWTILPLFSVAALLLMLIKKRIFYSR
jgi:hypothetical protein